MLLFGLYGGVLVDRLPKRPTLLVTQSAMALTGLALAALTLSGHVQVWHVYVAAFAVGLATVVDNPARQSFVSEMVGPDQLQNAVSLNSANFQSARLVGPAVAGVMITGVGTGWAFLFNGLSFVAPLASLLLMRNRDLKVVKRAPARQGPAPRGPPVRGQAPGPDLADRPRRLHRYLRLQLPGVAVGLRGRRLPRRRRRVQPLQHPDGGRLP